MVASSVAAQRPGAVEIRSVVCSGVMLEQIAGNR
jgi:hypothetical protein